MPFAFLARLAARVSGSKAIRSAKRAFSTVGENVGKVPKPTVRQRLSQLGDKIGYSFSSQERKLDRLKQINKITKEDIRLASSDIDVMGPESHARVRLFYRATQDIWQGLDVSEYNDAIMDALGVDNLEDAMKRVFEENEEALEELARSGTDRFNRKTGYGAYFSMIRSVNVLGASE